MCFDYRRGLCVLYRISSMVEDRSSAIYNVYHYSPLQCNQLEAAIVFIGHSELCKKADTISTPVNESVSCSVSHSPCTTEGILFPFHYLL